MSKRKARPSKSRSDRPTPVQGGSRSEGTSPPLPAAPTRWRVWLFRCALLALVPPLALLLLEAVLRLAGYGYPTAFFIRSDSGQAYVTNERFGWQFSPKASAPRPFLFRLPLRKPAGTVRICILGESAAMGTPDPAFGFGRILEVQLHRQFPGKQFEIINGAMRGINSYAIRTIARECAAHQVDVFVIYAGNNEVIGFHAPDASSSAWSQSLGLIRAGQWAKSTRLGQLLSALAGGLSQQPTEPEHQGMAYFRQHRLRADDWRRGKVRENFRANLQDICDVAARAGAGTVLCTVGANLKDFPPLASLHRNDLTPNDEKRWVEAYQSGVGLETNGQTATAIERYQAAARIDDHFADLHFRLGRCFLTLGDRAQAKQHYALARDWDALQFRTDSGINEVIRNVAAARRSQGVTLAEMEQAFAESDLSQRGIPGDRLFLDHVHPSFSGNYLLARKCFAGLVPVLAPRLGEPARAEMPTEKECAEAIGYTEYSEINIVSAMVSLTSRPPFLDQLEHGPRQAAAEAAIKQRLAAFSSREAEACLRTLELVVGREPDWWPTRFILGSFYQELGRYPAAVKHFQHIVEQFPQTKKFRLCLADALMQAGDKAAALAQLTEASRLDPHDPALRTIDRLKGK
jgi:tetratricopeptide (TPR) repeat protein